MSIPDINEYFDSNFIARYQKTRRRTYVLETGYYLNSLLLQIDIPKLKFRLHFYTVMDAYTDRHSFIYNHPNITG